MKYSVKNAKKAFLTLIEKLNSPGAGGCILQTNFGVPASKKCWRLVELA
jgi:hypothetical protein